MAKRSKGTSFRYRDRKTGKLVSKSTWKRSKAQGGKRYVRELQRKRKTKRPQGEYQINVRYKPSDKKTKVEVQISAQGPPNRSRQAVLRAVEHRRTTGENPEGWEINIQEWKKAGKTFKSDSGWTQLGFFFNESEKKIR